MKIFYPVKKVSQVSDSPLPVEVEYRGGIIAVLKQQGLATLFRASCPDGSVYFLISIRDHQMTREYYRRRLLVFGNYRDATREFAICVGH
jgi:hypothetical protein